jgi:WD40 repeat protein
VLEAAVTKILLVFSGIALLAIACAKNSANGDDANGTAGLISIAVTPGDLRLVIEGDQEVSEKYKAMGTFADGRVMDITNLVTFSLDDSRLGAFEGQEFTSNTGIGGRTVVQATDHEVFGYAQLTLVLQKRYLDPAADNLGADPGALFESGSPAPANKKPSLVYPNDEVLVPPNLRKLEFHLRPGEGNTIFELSYSSPVLDILVYTQCTVPLSGGCIFLPTSELWSWIADSSIGQSVSVGLRATDESGTVIGESSPITVVFSDNNVLGGVYYWATPKGGTDADSAILRWDFASSTQTEPERVVTTSLTGGNCVGCHALSRAGTRMVIATNGSYDANVLLFDLETQAPAVPYNSTPPSAFSSFSPDGSQFVGVFADETQFGFQSYGLNFFHGATGSYQESIDVGASETSPVTHPDWAPNGDAIVFTRIGEATNTSSGTTAFGRQASIQITERVNGDWTAPVALTSQTPGRSTYYPGFSPDGKLIVFNRSDCSNGDGEDCDMYDDPRAAMYVMKPESGATPVAVGRANAPGIEDTLAEVQNSFPKWAPFVFHSESELGSQLMWLTFSSNRSYGLHKPDAEFTLIWMFGLDPGAAAAGQDPSFAAFALPFQDLETDNHTAQWTEVVVGGID